MTIPVYPEYPFQSHFHTIGSHRLHYVDEGQGPVIIMVHGNPTWSFYYRKLITLLSRKNRVIAIDHLGCGLSDKPQDYNYCLQNHINNLSSLVHRLDVESFSLVVHDWGGAIGMGLAAENPVALEKVMVLNTAAFRSRRIPLRINVCRWPIIGEFLVRGLNGFAGPAIFMAVSKKMNRDVAEGYLAPYDSWKNRVAVAAFVKDIPLSPDHPSYQALVRVEQGLKIIQELRIPMLICWGGKDFCFNKHFYDEWCNRFPEAETHYFAGSGHYLLEDAFGEIAPLAQQFFHHSNQE
ncbi:MAG: alpha/beta fold hydrolase [Proteobacteria bacterium]|nr:alpha/beta fold hydrolase [Pseudomonadota bacterium]MBU1233730.1 alpha/beta fold hydrolase [Pseudomonadota bacterium]MBU1420479.1 alpha/beta fold hydrolase [Pseudomonadota bacterium]MBU1456042.1 alpha/beta fold hydrolase [Pseudomonadota bacterium]